MLEELFDQTQNSMGIFDSGIVFLGLTRYKME